MNWSRLPELAGLGATVVLYVLIVLSVIQLAIIIERTIVFWRTRRSRNEIEPILIRGVEGKDMATVGRTLAGDRALAARVLVSGTERASDGPEAVDEIMKGRLAIERQELERNLAFLGTLGNNAPFIGLFGTVLGIIRAFADLGASGTATGSQVVMAGISEALIATAVGLMVALPAVMSFNAFMRTIKNRVTDAESLASTLLAHLRRQAA